jgi:uncharacterized membrane protein
MTLLKWPMERRAPSPVAFRIGPVAARTIHSSSVTSVPSTRLAWIDWMRGLACVLMFQTHCYDAWLGGAARNTRFLKTSQLLGTLPAPLFLFLAGISFALVTDKLIRKRMNPSEITGTMFRRGAEILAFGFLFRLQEFLIAWGWAPWSDLLRVDVLNIIGLSMILMALLCGIILKLCRQGSSFKNINSGDSYQTPPSGASYQGMPSGIPQTAPIERGFSRYTPWLIAASISAASIIALLTPPLYTTWRPTWLPWPLESYIDGCHNLGAPQPWLFPLFPWAAFAFAGLAAGFILFSDQMRTRTAQTLAAFAVVGTLAILVARQFDHSSIHIYSTYDYWHTSPNFLMMRIGLLLQIAFLSYAWCRWGLATRGFSPLIQLGQTSLLVYWVHIEFVYGRFSLLPKQAESIPTASRGLLEIVLFMLILSLVRTRIDWKKVNWKKMIARKTSRTVQPA